MIVFDLMDTVVRDPFFADLPALFGEGFALIARHVDRDTWPAFERGTIDEATFLARFYRAQGQPGLPTPQAIKEAIVSRYRFVQGMEKLLVELLRDGRQLWVLSNYPRWFHSLRRQLALDRYFCGYSVSCLTGLRKPEAAAYQEVVAASGCDAERLVLVDDREENCAAARALGWQTIRFRDAAALRQELLPGPPSR